MAKNCCPSSSSCAGRLRQEPVDGHQNCCPSSSSARRLRQEPSITKNCCTSSSIREEFFFFFLNRQELSIECWKVQFRYFRNELFWQELDIVSCRRWSSTRFLNKQPAPEPGP